MGAMTSTASSAHRLRRLPVFSEELTNPNLRDPFGVNGRHASVKRVGIQLAVHEAREKNDRSALLGPDVNIQASVGAHDRDESGAQRSAVDGGARLKGWSARHEVFWEAGRRGGPPKRTYRKQGVSWEGKRPEGG